MSSRRRPGPLSAELLETASPLATGGAMLLGRTAAIGQSKQQQQRRQLPPEQPGAVREESAWSADSAELEYPSHATGTAILAPTLDLFTDEAQATQNQRQQPEKVFEETAAPPTNTTGVNSQHAAVLSCSPSDVSQQLAEGACGGEQHLEPSLALLCRGLFPEQRWIIRNTFIEDVGGPSLELENKQSASAPPLHGYARLLSPRYLAGPLPHLEAPQPLPAPATPEPSLPGPPTAELEGQPWHLEDGIPDFPDDWPNADRASVTPLGSGRMLVRWLVRSHRLLRRGSNDQRKASPPFTLHVDGQDSRFRLQLMASSQGTSHRMSGFGASQGRGRVQILMDGEPLASFPRLQIRIATGRHDAAGSWRGPQEAVMRGLKPSFELAGEEWNFKLAQDRDCQELLPIVVEITPVAMS